MTQSKLAGKLGISQGYLSKLLARTHKPGIFLEHKARELLQAEDADKAGSKEWLETVKRLAQQSVEFQALVNAAIKIMHSHS
jgi:transcriptional regulator with XRE-family HTH domain